MNTLAIIARCLALLLLFLFEVGLSTAAAQATFEITPSSAVIGVKGKAGLIGIYDPDGPAGPLYQEVIDSSNIKWSVSNPALARLSGGRFIYGLTEGSVIVTGQYLGLSAQAQITISGQQDLHSFITPDGRTRYYLLYIPASYSKGTPAPLVLNFHGGGGNGQNQQDISLMNATAKKYGFVLAYPYGTSSLGTDPAYLKFVFNSGSCCGFAASAKVDDVLFTKMLIERISEAYSIDKDRVYSTGFSNGASLSHRLGCELSESITAIGPVAAGLSMGGDFTQCTPKRAAPVYEFHGTTDTNYPFLGGDSAKGEKFPIPDTIGVWYGLHGFVFSDQSSGYSNGSVSCSYYTNSSTPRQVILCVADPSVKITDASGRVLDGGGHAWPGGRVGAASYADFPNTEIDFNERLWLFFSQYSMKDSDSDGTADYDDLCPHDAGKTHPGACGCGTPDTFDENGRPICGDASPPNSPRKLRIAVK